MSRTNETVLPGSTFRGTGVGFAPVGRQPLATNQCCGWRASQLAIAEVLEHFERRLAEWTTFTRTVLAIVHKVERADAVGAARVGQVGSRVKLLGRRSSKDVGVVSFGNLCPGPGGVAQLEVERSGTGHAPAYGSKVLALCRVVVRRRVHHIDADIDQCPQVETEPIEHVDIARHANAQPSALPVDSCGRAFAPTS